MVEMHLLSVNVDFSYNPIYALGVVTSFDRFMEGYQPERDKESIFNALCKAVEDDSQRYRQDAQRLQTSATSFPTKDFIAMLSHQTYLAGADDLQTQLQAIASNPKFKYSRLFAIGLYTLLESSSVELVKDEKQRTEALNSIATGLHLPEDKLNKDLELYRSNLDKMSQALVVLADMLTADRKKREQRAKEQSATANPPSKNES